MKLGFCSNAYTEYSLEESIRRVGALGYDGIELLCDTPHYWPPRETPERTERLIATLRTAGLSVTNVNANTATGYYAEAIEENIFGPSLSSGDPARRAQRREHVRGALRLAEAVGAANVSVTSGASGDDHPPDVALDVLRDSLRPLLSEADQLGIDIGLEAEPGLLLETTEEAAAFVASVGHPRLGLNLDIGHAVVVGEDPATMIRRHAPFIWHLHLEDIRDGKHFHHVPGDGDVDFDAILEALLGVGFDRAASVEVYPFKADPDAAAQRAREALVGWGEGQ